MNRGQRRAIQQNRENIVLPGTERHGGVPLIHGGQRWRCVNAMCGDVPPNVERNIPYGVAIQTPAGKDVHLCKKCFDAFMSHIVRCVPMLMPFDTESGVSFEDQILELQQRNADQLADRMKEADAKLAEAQSMEERAAGSGLTLAR